MDTPVYNQLCKDRGFNPLVKKDNVRRIMNVSGPGRLVYGGICA